MRRKIADVIASLGSYLCNGGESEKGTNLWPELFPSLFHMVSNADFNLVEVGLKIIRGLMDNCGKMLLEDPGPVIGILQKALNSGMYRLIRNDWISFFPPAKCEGLEISALGH